MKTENEKALSILKQLVKLNKGLNLTLHCGPMVGSVVQRAKKWIKQNDPVSGRS